MATPFVSPGAYTREIDQSLYVRQLSDTALGVVGTAQWGPLNTPTLITSADQLVRTFGNPTGLTTQVQDDGKTAQHPMYYTLLQFLRKARRAWVVRVAHSGSAVQSSVDLYEATAPTGSNDTAIRVKAKYPGVYGDNIRLRITAGTKGATYRKLQVFLASPKDATKMSLVETFDNLTKDNPAVVLPDTDETDPNTAADSWQSKINGVSQYIKVTQGSSTLQPDLVSSSAPVTNDLAVVSPSLAIGDTYYQLSGGADGDVGLTDADLAGDLTSGPDNGPSGLHCFDNAEAFVVNVVAIPGPQKRVGSDHTRSGMSSELVTELIDLCTLRQDCMGLIDPPFGLTPTQVAAWSNGDYNLDDTAEGQSINSNLLACYYPWVQIFDEFSGSKVYIPPSAFAAEAIANTDFTTDPWFAPAGLNRARVDNAIRAERTLTLGERDYLYSGDPNIINPIATFQGTGIVIWGQRTMQRTATSLDRINVRRMLLLLRKLISTALQSLVFEPNDPVLWRRFRGLVTPFLQAVQNRRGITNFRVVMDESTNTPDVIEQNMCVGKIFIQPTKTAEIIVVDFVLTPQGAQFDEIVNSLGGSVNA